MLQTIQLLIAICIIVLIVPQTPTENGILRRFLDTGFFENYSEAKSVVRGLTWFLIFTFLISTFGLSLI